MKHKTLTQRSVLSELRALGAMARKEWTIFVRYPSWVVAMLVWPVLLPVGYVLTARAFAGPDGSSLSAFKQVAGTADYIGFTVVGTALWGWLNMTLWTVGTHLRGEQMQGTLEANWLCPVWRISIMLGATLSQLAISLFMLAMTATVFWLLFGINLAAGNPGLLALILLLVVPSIYGIGLIFGSLVLRFKEANAMVFLVRGVFMIFCGITFPLQVLPGWMRGVASWLPLTYAIQDFRAVILAGAGWGEIAGDLQKLAVFAVALPLVGYLAFAFTERRARRSGVLGQY